MNEVKVLDHGYVKLIETWGSDSRIIEAARMSTDKGFLGWGPTCSECGWAKGDDHEVGCSRPETYKPGDEKLLRYLWEHKHSTPFEMAGAIFEIQAPIFVFREWHRHRSQSFNEMSARYIPMPNFHYVPTVDRLMMGSDGTNKQAGTVKGSKQLTVAMAEQFRQNLIRGQQESEERYQLSLQMGVPKELARLDVLVSRYSRMRVSANLRNWLAFVTLRSDSNAQWEIQQYSNIVLDFLGHNFEKTIDIFKGNLE